MGAREQVAIVTGGASGIGLALGAALVQQGRRVVLADLQDVVAKEHADRLTTRGPGSAVGVHVDVRNPEAVAGLVGSTHAERGRLDLMVNNAGISLDPVEPEELELVHSDRDHRREPARGDPRLPSRLPADAAAGPRPDPQRRLHGGCDPQRQGNLAPYAATEFGVVGSAMRCVPRELDRGIRVTVLCPGFIDTPLPRRGMARDLPKPPSVATSAPRRESVAELGVPLYPADRLAEDTIRGLERNKAVLVIPSGAHRYWLMTRLMPGLVERQTLAVTRSMRKKVGQPAPARGTDGWRKQPSAGQWVVGLVISPDRVRAVTARQPNPAALG